jgi:hypothetical protein
MFGLLGRLVILGFVFWFGYTAGRHDLKQDRVSETATHWEVARWGNNFFKEPTIVHSPEGQGYNDPLIDKLLGAGK